MSIKTCLIALALLAPAAANAQSSNTSSNSSSNNGGVRERIVDTYCDGGWCERREERREYHDGSNRGWEDRGRDWERRDGREWRDRDDRHHGNRRFQRWALRNFDWNRDGRLGRREYRHAINAWYRR